MVEKLFGVKSVMTVPKTSMLSEVKSTKINGNRLIS